MLLIEVSMFPLGKGEHVSAYVSRSLNIIDKSGLDYQLNSMGTVIEGEWDEVMAVIKKCYLTMKKDCPRIAFTMKGDWKSGPDSRIKAKITSVEEKLGRRLTK